VTTTTGQANKKDHPPCFQQQTTLLQAESLSSTRDVANVEAVRQTIAEEPCSAAPVLASIVKHKKDLQPPETLGQPHVNLPFVDHFVFASNSD
jgi:hypothetical protein